MRKIIFWNFIAVSYIISIISSCSDKAPAHSIKRIEEKSSVVEKESGKESYNYFEYKWLVEEFPFNNSNSSNFYREYLKSNYTKNNKTNFRSFPNWESLGPANIAGRSLCLAINPQDTNQLWMGSAGSGLWKSNKGGIGKDAWNYVSTGYPVTSISSIAIRADQPNVMYVGTGEIYNYDGSDGGILTRTLRGSRGIGILKSIDGGRHWNLSLDWTLNNQTAIWKIIIHPKNPNIAFAATNLGIYKTLDGGNKWINVLDLPLVMDLIIDTQEPNILYAGVGGLHGTHYGVYKTIDEGLNWNLVRTPNDTVYNGRIMLANYKSNTKQVFATYSDDFKTIALMRSSEGFDSSNFYFPIKDVCSHQGWYAKCLHVKDDDSKKLIIGGVDLYLDTTGTGNQLFNLIYWRIKIHADMHDIISNPLDPNKIYIATDGGLYRSDDFAHSFYSCNQGYLSAQFYTGNISTHSSRLLGGLQDNKSTIFVDVNDWRNIHQGDGTYNAFHPWYDSILYVSSQYQNLYVSQDFGLNWRELIVPNLSASFVSPFLINSKSPSKIYSGGNQLLITNNGGNSWDTSFLLSNDESIVAMETIPGDENKIYISTLNVNTKESHLYFSKDSGLHLQLREEGIPERFIRDIAIDPHNPKTMYLALGGQGQPGIMKSTDASANWSFPQNKNLPDVPFHSVLVDPKDSDILYAGCDFGLFVSMDQGETWSAYNTHPYDLVAVYDIKYSKFENKLILFTHGFGAFRCSLLDKSILTGTNHSNHLNIIINSLNEFIEFPENLKSPTNLTLINIEGKLIHLPKTGNGFSTKSLESGVYFIVSNELKLKDIKIVIAH